MKRKFGQLAEDYVSWQLGQVGIPAPVTSYAIRRFRGMPSVGTQTANVGYGSGTYTRGRRQYGRRVSRRSTKYARFLANAFVRRTVFGSDSYTNFGGTNGAHYITNWSDPGIGAYRAPLHLWDVTAAPNNVGGVYTVAQSGYKLGFDTAGVASTVNWRTLGNGLDAVNNNSSTLGPGNSSLLRGVKAKFMFYCPQNISTKITVSLVQILDEKFHPPKNPAGAILDVGGESPDDTALAVLTDAGAVAFWQAAVHKNAKNPVACDNGNALKNLKVLKSHTFILNPKETTDTTNTTMHQYDFYHKFNRRVKYNWQDQTGIVVAGAAPAGDDAVSVNVGANKCSPEPRARMYLMVTALSKYNAAADFIDGYWPSYDIVLRTYHDQN